MINYMKEVTKLLGVKVGEVFKLIDGDSGKYPNYYRFTTERGFECSCDNTNWGVGSPRMLNGILTGKVSISKLSWRPQVWDTYYIPSINNKSCYYNKFQWRNDNCDREFYNRKIVCRTKEEAIVLAREMLVVAQKKNEQ